MKHKIISYDLYISFGFDRSHILSPYSETTWMGKVHELNIPLAPYTETAWEKTAWGILTLRGSVQPVTSARSALSDTPLSPYPLSLY